jgi:hypothetical protein
MYVRNRQRRGLGRVARAYRFSGIRGLRGLRGARRLGQDDGDIFDMFSDAPLDPTAAAGVIQAQSVYSPTPSLYSGSVLSPGGSYAGSSGLSPADLSLISQGISSGTLLASKALTPVPTVTYNPTTGAYTSVGGAVLPSSITSGLGSLTAYIPYLLIGGVLIAAVSMLKK